MPATEIRSRGYLCECANRRCRHEAQLTPHRYEQMIALGLRVVAPTHVGPYDVVVALGPDHAAVLPALAAMKLKRDLARLQPRVRRTAAAV